MEISAHEAQIAFLVLLERAAKGESVIITDHGNPLAQLTPIKAGTERDQEKIKKAIEEIRKIGNASAAFRQERVQKSMERVAALREGVTLPPGVTVCDLIKEGRRY